MKPLPLHFTLIVQVPLIIRHSPPGSLLTPKGSTDHTMLNMAGLPTLQRAQFVLHLQATVVDLLQDIAVVRHPGTEAPHLSVQQSHLPAVP
jgi:hypothetical protein